MSSTYEVVATEFDLSEEVRHRCPTRRKARRLAREVAKTGRVLRAIVSRRRTVAELYFYETERQIIEEGLKAVKPDARPEDLYQLVCDEIIRQIGENGMPWADADCAGGALVKLERMPLTSRAALLEEFHRGLDNDQPVQET